MNKGDSVIEIKTGNQYVVFDSSEDEICILVFFNCAQYPYKRQLKIWQPKTKFLDLESFYDNS